MIADFDLRSAYFHPDYQLSQSPRFVAYDANFRKAYLVEEEIRPRGLDISFTMGAR